MENCPRCGAWLKGNGVTVPYHCPNTVVPRDAAPDDRVFICDLDEEEIADLRPVEIFSDE